MEVLFGTDNQIFISILANRLPEHQQKPACFIEMGLAVILHRALLSPVAVVVKLAERDCSPEQNRCLSFPARRRGGSIRDRRCASSIVRAKRGLTATLVLFFQSKRLAEATLDANTFQHWS